MLEKATTAATLMMRVLLQLLTRQHLRHRFLQVFSDPVSAGNLHSRSDLFRIQYLHFAIKANWISGMHEVCVFADNMSLNDSGPFTSRKQPVMRFTV